MNIRYLFDNLKVDGRTREYIEKRLQKIGRMLPNILQEEVEIGVDKKGLFRVEVMVKTPKDLYRSEETTESIEGSIDTAVDELQEQIRKEKEKLKVLKERGARSIKKKTVLDRNSRFKK